jgi:hypothetical protein
LKLRRIALLVALAVGVTYSSGAPPRRDAPESGAWQAASHALRITAARTQPRAGHHQGRTPAPSVTHLPVGLLPSWNIPRLARGVPHLTAAHRTLAFAPEILHSRTSRGPPTDDSVA